MRREFGSEGSTGLPRIEDIWAGRAARPAGESAAGESEVRFRVMADSAPVLIWMCGPDKLCNFFNKPWLDFVGRTLEQEMGNGWADGVHAADLERCLDTFHRSFDARQEFTMDYRLRRADGEYRWIVDRGVPRYSPSGQFLGYIGSCIDITERKRTEALMAHQHRILCRIASGMPLDESLAELTAAIEAHAPEMLCALLLLDGQGRPSSVVAPSLKGRRPEDGDWPAAFIAECQRADPGEESTWKASRELACRFGFEACWLEPVRSSSGELLGTFALCYRGPHLPGEAELELIGAAAHLAAIAVEAAHGREQLIHHALHDPLTGLPNRKLFLDRLDMAMKRAARRETNAFAVLFIDLDRFKVINDSLGHMLGDELLKQIAARLKRCLRPADTVARLGGDEFVLLLEDLVADAEEQAVRIATRIQADLAAPFEVGGEEIFSSASIGIAFGSAAYRRPEELLRDADTAMYRAKLLGRARHAVFVPAMHQRALSQLKIESALRRALERREFRLHYQPIVELDRGQLVGFEALLRWQHPEHGLLLPEHFLDAAEDTGIMPGLGRWVLEEACRQTAEWQRNLPPERTLAINVNLHPAQLVPQALARQIDSIIAESGLTPGSLRVEITEHTLLSEIEAAIETLEELRALGVGVCLDDFGTGYSSLSYLLRFPVTTLKIDRSLVGSICHHGEVAIIKSLTSLAHTLSLDVVAEGLETALQLSSLRKLGCEKAQGFLFSAPLESAAVLPLLNGHPPGWLQHFPRRLARRRATAANAPLPAVAAAQRGRSSSAISSSATRPSRAE